MKKHILSVIALVSILFLYSCTNDEPTFTLTTPLIDQSNYSAGGQLSLNYSIDGVTFTSAIPKDLPDGATLKVKVISSAGDLDSNNFSFDWSGSVPAPADINAPIAEVKVSGKNISLNVKINDIYTGVTYDFNSSVFYQIDLSTGLATDPFIVKEKGLTVEYTRSMVYHKNENKLFLLGFTQTGNSNRKLYSLAKGGLEATFIYEFLEASIDQITLDADNNLVLSGRLRLSNEISIYTSTPTGIVTQAAIRFERDEFWNHLGTNKKDVIRIVTKDIGPDNSALINSIDVDILTGATTNNKTITSFLNFPTDTFGKIYPQAICNGNSPDEAFIVFSVYNFEDRYILAKVNFEKLTIEFVADIKTKDNLGISPAGLSIVPKHALQK